MAPYEAPLIGALQPASREELEVVHLLDHGVTTALEEILHHLLSPGDGADLLGENLGAKSGHSVLPISGMISYKLTSSTLSRITKSLYLGPND